MSPGVSHLSVHEGDGGAGLVDPAVLEPLCTAIEDGAGLIEVVRAAARALDASVVLADRTSSIVAVATRSPAEERVLVAGGRDVQAIDLRLGDEVVGQLRLRARGQKELSPALVRAVATFVALEAERLRAPDRASAAEVGAFVRAVLSRELDDRAAIVERAVELGLDLDQGAVVVVARAHPIAAVEEGWRPRLHAVAERAARGTAAGTIAVLADAGDRPSAEVYLLVPGGDETTARRVAAALRTELESALHGATYAIGLSRPADDPLELARAGAEALLAANVAESGGEESVLEFERTGAYRLLLSAMSEDRAELERFYADTLEPVVAYDEQYETDLVTTLATYLDSDGNVAGTAQRLFTHRHTVRYRLERVKELSGHDVGSSEGREKLSLGLKAMRVLGIHAPRGPADELGANAGRVPQERKDRQ